MTMQSFSAIRSQLDAAIKTVYEFKDLVTRIDCAYTSEFALAKDFDQAVQQIKNLDRKPIVGFFGSFDTGKSTLINWLIGQDVLPVSFMPTTSVLNLVLHEKDKPQGIEGQVAVFKRGFLPYMMNDAKLVSKYLIKTGGLDLLNDFGVHKEDEGDFEKKRLDTDAYIATVFVNAPILEKVWLLDTPGANNSPEAKTLTARNSDTEIALSGSELADGILFLAPVAGYLQTHDCGYSGQLMRRHAPITQSKPFDHFMFVLTHCSTTPYAQIERVMKSRYSQVKTVFNELVFAPWKEENLIEKIPEVRELTDRSTPFAPDNKEYCEKFASKFDELLAYLTQNHQKTIETHISHVSKELKGKLFEAIHILESRKITCLERLEGVKEQDARFRQEITKLDKAFQALIDSCDENRQEDIHIMQDFYRNMTNKETLIELINELYSDADEARKNIGSYIGQKFNTKLEMVLKRSGNSVSQSVDSMIDQWQRIVPDYRFQRERLESVDVDISPDLPLFDAKAAFLGGLGGLSALGAMSAWVAAMTSSNLGAYILVAKVAGVLVSAGLASSCAAVVSGVASLGGPITIGIGIATTIGYSIYKFFSNDWTEDVASAVQDSLDDEDIFRQIENTIKDFWENTKISISAGKEALAKKTEEHIAALYADAEKDYNRAELDKGIAGLKAIVDKM